MKFSGTGGIKGLFLVEESFQKIANKFSWNDGAKLVGNFDLVVEEGDADHWETIIDRKHLTVDGLFQFMYGTIPHHLQLSRCKRQHVTISRLKQMYSTKGDQGY